MKYVLCEGGVEEFTAGVKAPADVVKIALANGYAPLRVNGCVPKRDAARWMKVVKRLQWTWVGFWSYFRFKRGDVVLLPTGPGFLCRRSGYGFLARLQKKGVKFIFVVHDIDCLRQASANDSKGCEAAFMASISMFDVLIVHNGSMRKWLCEHGEDDRKMIELGVFDYLTDCVAPGPDESGAVCFAGNLDPRKSTWIREMTAVKGVSWNLYGPYYNEALNRQGAINYGGCFPPDELPAKLRGSFGLIWDGDSIDTCCGTWGAYERYNNPHKLSLYLATGLPVIVWSEAATAEFVIKNGLGICISSLRGLADRLKALRVEDYVKMKAACITMAQKVRSGWFMSKALEDAVHLMEM